MGSQCANSKAGNPAPAVLEVKIASAFEAGLGGARSEEGCPLAPRALGAGRLSLHSAPHFPSLLCVWGSEKARVTPAVTLTDEAAGTSPRANNHGTKQSANDCLQTLHTGWRGRGRREGSPASARPALCLEAGPGVGGAQQSAEARRCSLGFGEAGAWDDDVREESLRSMEHSRNLPGHVPEF